jgi:hypothetical protein
MDAQQHPSPISSINPIYLDAQVGSCDTWTEIDD